MNEELKSKLLKQSISDTEQCQGPHEAVMARVLESQALYDADSVLPDANGGKSGFKMKDVKRTIEGSLPDLVEPFTADTDLVKVAPANGRSVIAARILTKLINDQYTKSFNRVKFIEEIAKNIQIEGTVITKVSWKEDKPTVVYLPINEVMIDPTAKSIEEANYVIQRRRVSIGDILASPNWYGKHTLESLSKLEAVTTTEYDDVRYEGEGYDSSVNYEDRLRTQVEIFEYYGLAEVDGELKPVLTIRSDETLLQARLSPYPESWTHPFEAAVYIRKPFNIYGDTLPELIGDYQAVRDAFTRGVIDNAALATNGQIFIQKGGMDQMNFRRMINGDKHIYMNQPPETVLKQGTFNEIPASVFHLMDQFKTDQEELSGISRMNGGVDPRALHSTATGASIANDNSKKRIISITRHISEMLERVFIKWIEMNQMLLQDGVVEKGGEYHPVTAEDINGDFDVTVGAAGLDSQKMLNMSQMMQTMTGSGQDIPNHIYMGMLSEIAHTLDMELLSKQLLELVEESAKASENPQPNPQEQIMMMEKQAGIEKMNSETAKNYAAAGKSQADSMSTHVETEKAVFGLD